MRMAAVSCTLLRDTAKAAEPIKFEISPWSQHGSQLTYHTICTTTDGSVFTWGAGAGGRLGTNWSGNQINKLVPTLVRGELLNKAVVQVAAGG